MSAPGKVVFALLNGDAGVTALVGANPSSRIYAGRAPEKCATPYIVINKISDVRVLPIDAQPGSIPCQARMQASCFDTSPEGAKSLADAARSACDRKSGTINGVQVSAVLWDADSPDGYDFDVNLYHQPVDFLVHFYR